MASRLPYTPETVAAVKWDLTRATIDRAVHEAVLAQGPDRCLVGNPDTGYWLALDHTRGVPHQPELVAEELRPAMGHYRLPPVTPDRTSVEPAVHEDFRGEPVQVYDPWGAPEGDGFHPQGLYTRYAEGMDVAFECWGRLLDVPDFWAVVQDLLDRCRHRPGWAPSRAVAARR